MAAAAAAAAVAVSGPHALPRSKHELLFQSNRRRAAPPGLACRHPLRRLPLTAASASTSASSSSSSPSSPPAAPSSSASPSANAVELRVSVLGGVGDVERAEWDACAAGAGPDPSSPGNPFVSWDFLKTLEDSASATRLQGWAPCHLAARNASGNLLGVMPLYLKSHSYGEYVFDHSWASAYARYGRSYYPKLQSCVPFSPVTGPRLLTRQGSGPEVMAVRAGLARSVVEVAEQFNVSSAHVTFPTRDDWNVLASEGFLQRVGVQYHWSNRGYKDFEDFLAALKQSRRKSIRQERKKVKAMGVEVVPLTGSDLRPEHWAAFYTFYRNTTSRKWGQAYLTREFFELLGERMADRILLVMARAEGKWIAGALNLIGDDALYGRNWGCITPEDKYPGLHFEVCYYQAVEWAIAHGLARVEAGAQGEHKIPRGYLPTQTYSAHLVRDEAFSDALSHALRRERVQMQQVMDMLGDDDPFKRTPAP
eukprot:jgi/Chlat1/6046/Chrsp4S06331